jgi:hypothetical protein
MAENPQQDPQQVPFLTPKKDENLPEKKVSAKAHNRLKLAANAIQATKTAIPKQGNQVPALQSSNMNSQYRLAVMRDLFDEPCWEYTSDVARQLAAENPEADTAAKADIAHGGNCGEHADLAYHHLRLHAGGEHIQLSAKKGLDHAFVILGDLAKDKDDELAVSDPWPNAPTACLWEDHFAHCTRDKIEDNGHMVADGKSFKSAIAAGLKLTAFGKRALEAKEDDATTKKKTVDDRAANHFWNHENTTAAGAKFDYKVDQPPKQQSDSQQPQR